MENKMNEVNERKYGIVKRFFGSGFGFLFCEDMPVDIFFHLHNWRSVEEPVVGQRVTFELGPAKAPGHPEQAVLIRPVMSAGIEALAKGIDPINAVEVSPEIGVKAGV
jgi:cold shock CspA family protein